jgi:hypothetical protein
VAENVYEQVIKGIRLEINTYFEKAMAKFSRRALREIRTVVKENIKNNPIYQRLISGESIYHQLGVIDLRTQLNAIVDLIVDKIRIDYDVTKFLKRTSGADFKFTVTFLDFDYSELLQDENAIFITEKGFVIEWLQWLLIEGNNPIIIDFHYKPTYSDASRTGYGIMVPKGTWSVPPGVSGTQYDNWITQSMDRVNEIIPGIVEKLLEEEFNGG